MSEGKPFEETVSDSLESVDLANSGSSPASEKEAANLSRRKLLSGAGVLGASVLMGKIPNVANAAEPVSPILDLANDTTQALGRPGVVLGKRSSHEKITRFLRPGKPWTSGTPHEDLMGTITPSDLHFERHHGGVPEIDPAKYALMIHGMVERPMVFSIDDLKRFPSVTRIHFLECSGHYPFVAKENMRPSRIAPLLSNSEWTGVPLSTLFEEVGVHRDANWFLAEGQDSVVMARSIPIEKAWDDSMIAYGQNGEPLRPSQGYPARLFNPGWEGNTSVKWLRRIELTDRPTMTREETARYTDKTSGGKARQFSFVMDTRSLITYPGYPESIHPGMVDIQGIAWSGRGRIAKVEVSVDDRKTWKEARLQMPLLSKAFTRFQLSWKWTGEPTSVWSRATDESGYVQPTMEAFSASRGGERGYHENFQVGWDIRAGGDVFYKTQEWPA